MGAVDAEMLMDLYSCPSEPERWRSVMDRICRKLEVGSAAVQLLRRRGDVMEQIWVARDSASAREADLRDRAVNNSLNPRFNLKVGRNSGPTGIVRDGDRFAPGCRHFSDLQNRCREPWDRGR